MSLDARRVVVAGGATGLEAIFEVRYVSPALTTESASVTELVEIGDEGSLKGSETPWHHDPEPDGAIFRLVTLKPVPPGHVRPLHGSPTVDFGLVLVGTVELALPGGERMQLTAGDSFALRGIEHAWTNRGPGDCQLVVTLLSPSAWSATESGGSVES